MIEKDAKYIKNFPGRRPWKLNKPLDTDVTFDSPIDSGNQIDTVIYLVTRVHFDTMDFDQTYWPKNVKSTFELTLCHLIWQHILGN